MPKRLRCGWAFVTCLSTIAFAMPSLSQGISEDAMRIARLQSQILELEEQIRRLTGRLEEAEFTQRRTDQRVDRLIEDMDQRLQSIEQVPNQTAIARNPDLAALPTVSPEPVRVQPPPQSLPTTEQEGVLGTIPRDALLGLPTPDNTTGVEPSPSGLGGDAGSRYSAIQELLATGDFGASAPALRSFLNDFPDAPQASEASFMLGEISFIDEQYPEAAAQFAENFRKFGATDSRAADNLLKLGMSLNRLGDVERACTAYSEFKRRFPEASTALKRMADREQEAASCS